MKKLLILLCALLFAATAHAVVELDDDDNGAIDADLGGTNIDTSSSTGYPSISAGTWSVIKHNLGAAVDPQDTNDSSEGYALGSWWINTTATPATIWQCIDATIEGAVWQTIGTAIIDDTAGSGVTTKTYSASKIIATYMPLAGGTFTAFPYTPESLPLETDLYKVANVAYVNGKVADQGTLASQDSDNVSITGGSISGVTLSYGSLSANGYKGETYSMAAGENLTAYDVVAVRSDSGTPKAYKYSAATGDAAKTNIPIGIVVATTSSGDTATILLRGIVRNSGWTIANDDIGKQVFGSDSSDGGILLAAPDTSGDIVVVIGKVIDGDDAEIIYLNPSVDYATVE